MQDAPERPAEDGLLWEILSAPDRDHSPGARPIVSWRDDDERDYLAELGRFAPRRFELERRGTWHGLFAELADDSLVPPLGPPRDAILAQRWHTARPIPLVGFAPALERFAETIAARRRLHDELKEEGGLRRFLKGALPEGTSGFRVHHRPPERGRDARDIERVTIHWRGDGAGAASGRHDLWAKCGWLSNRDDDESLRLRLSFGREVDDDASRDLAGHRLVAELTRELFPETELAENHPWLADFLERQVGGPLFFTQAIAYWNARGGGALMHHDGFAEPIEGGQRGVLYLQLSGRTAWIALSIEDLCRRVREFLGYLEEGELGWVRQRLFPDPAEFERVLKLATRFPRLRRELGKPGCGLFAALVNQGPEFSALLADAGHMVVLETGDAILLPNQGLERTCMHSVFGLSDEPGYALSLALRERRPPEPAPEAEETSRARAEPPGGGDRRGRRGGSSGRRGPGRGRRGGRGRGDRGARDR